MSWLRNCTYGLHRASTTSLNTFRDHCHCQSVAKKGTLPPVEMRRSANGVPSTEYGLRITDAKSDRSVFIATYSVGSCAVKAGQSSRARNEQCAAKASCIMAITAIMAEGEKRKELFSLESIAALMRMSFCWPPFVAPQI